MNRPLLSAHALEMLKDRRILIEWVWRAWESPDLVEKGIDDNMHYMKAIIEKGNRVLRVVVDEDVNPNRIVTLFFDRRLTRGWWQK